MKSTKSRHPRRYAVTLVQYEKDMQSRHSVPAHPGYTAIVYDWNIVGQKTVTVEAKNRRDAAKKALQSGVVEKAWTGDSFVEPTRVERL